MALVIEDGSGVIGANSHVTAQNYDDWATARGISHTHSNTQLEHFILRAMDYFENLNFLGRKATDSQPLQWPRTEVVIDSYSVDSDEIPAQVKSSMYELVKTISEGDFYLDPVSRETTKEKIGEIEVTYSATAGMKRLTPGVTTALKKITLAVDKVSRA